MRHVRDGDALIENCIRKKHNSGDDEAGGHEEGKGPFFARLCILKTRWVSGAQSVRLNPIARPGILFHITETESGRVR